jgi:uncharacterized protein (TIGR03435 family)
MNMQIAAAIVFALMMTTTLWQKPPGETPAQELLAFEVASVRVNHSQSGSTRRIEPDRITYLSITLGEFIEMAYGMKHYQISAPDWVVNFASSERYDIVAKSADPVSTEQLQAMLAPLLGERFHLAIHRETRELPVYTLVVDHKGPKFKAGDGGPTHIRTDSSGGHIYENYSMDALASSLSLYRAVGRSVLNGTGLQGGYNFSMNLQSLPIGVSPAGMKSAVTDNDEPLFTALQEQLGLKLKAEKAPVEILIVDHADKLPKEN